MGAPRELGVHDVVKALSMEVPVAVFRECQHSQPGRGTLLPVNNPVRVGYEDVQQHFGVLRAILTLSPTRTPPAGILQAAFAQLDEDNSYKLSGARTATDRRMWSAGEAAVLQGLLSYVRRLWRKGCQGDARSPLIQAGALPAYSLPPVRPCKHAAHMHTEHGFSCMQGLDVGHLAGPQQSCVAALQCWHRPW